ncbi:MAG: ATP-binding protein [Planctomycetota bacterium]|nr:ATP-binding protein [Planctomycetota bacterium]
MVRTVSDFAAARTVQEDLLERARELGYSAETAFAIRLAFEEAVNNAIRHGNAMDAAKAVRIEYEVTPARVAIAIADEGRGFDPGALPDPTCDENLEKPGGRGVMLMRAYMDKVTFNRRGNRVCMVKLNRP